MTASNSDRSIVLETDVPLQRREVETEKRVKAARAAMAAGATPPGSPLAKDFGAVLGSIVEDFVERLWGFLSVKEGLRSRLRSQTSREREDHIQQATNLSLTYNFLTPLTNMVVEKPSVPADGTPAPPTNEALSAGNEVLGEPVGPAGPGSRPPTRSNTVGEAEHSAPLRGFSDRKPRTKATLTHRPCECCFPFKAEVKRDP